MLIHKEKPDEQKLLADAKRWFEQKYGLSPDECGIKFIKIWHDPTFIGKTTAVVFAPTKEGGEAFIWEQNAIWRGLKSVFIMPVVFTFAVLLFAFTTEIHIFTVSATLCILTGVLMMYLAKKCQKLEKIHKWNVEMYYPQH